MKPLKHHCWLYLAVVASLAGVGFNATNGWAQSPSAERSVSLGINYLLDQQSDDKLWHSQHYGNLKDGAAVSALVLYAIGHVPERDWTKHHASLQQCLDGLATQIERAGFVTNPDGPDYSNYGSAMVLLASRSLRLKLADKHRQRLIQYLLRAQLDEDEGYSNKLPDYGGWDLSGWMKGERKTTGTNISVTASVLEALISEYQFLLAVKRSSSQSFTSDQQKQAEQLRDCFSKAQRWIKQVSHQDGGFFFHPEKRHLGNKAEWSDEASTKPKSYGSTTADGIRCLAALRIFVQSQGDKAQPELRALDERIKLATKWLSGQESLATVPGFPDSDAPSSWAHGLKYYFWMALAKSAETRTPKGLGLSKAELAIPGQIIELQGDRGCWQNRNARMREDDPIVATSFAIIALARTAKKQLHKK